MQSNLNKIEQRLALKLERTKEKCAKLSSYVDESVSRMNEKIEKFKSNHLAQCGRIDKFVECASKLSSSKYIAYLIKELQVYIEKIGKKYKVKVPRVSKMITVFKKKFHKRKQFQYTKKACFQVFTPRFLDENIDIIKSLKIIVDEVYKNFILYNKVLFQYEILSDVVMQTKVKCS
ncbi:hypothetical protein KSF78_0009003 [Schistosoma japonicum]|nr:hypothetical protein KSF78_0009003 [Schistosoma japonicum]KAH8858754.1 hypothetical protein KSF78_0009003 [Schistosoma japonicum]